MKVASGRRSNHRACAFADRATEGRRTSSRSRAEGGREDFWSDRHHKRTGSWPTQFSGSVSGAAGETWAGINAALRYGYRGLPGGDSLFRLLGRERGAGSDQG